MSKTRNKLSAALVAASTAAMMLAPAMSRAAQADTMSGDIVNNGDFIGCTGFGSCGAWAFNAIGNAFQWQTIGGTTFAEFFAHHGKIDRISQVLPTVPGQSYTLSFDVQAFCLPDGHSFCWGFSILFELGANSFLAVGGDSNITPLPLTTFSYNVTATSMNEELLFAGSGGDIGTFYLTNVSMVPVPAPIIGAGLSGLLAALIIFGGFYWKRRTA